MSSIILRTKKIGEKTFTIIKDTNKVFVYEGVDNSKIFSSMEPALKYLEKIEEKYNARDID